MTRDETKQLLMEMAVLYPSYEPKQKNPTLAVNLWTELLQERTYEEAHKALMKYAKYDQTGFAPTIGQLFPEEEVICIRDETIEDWN